MDAAMNTSSDHALVLGLGPTGLSCVRHLRAQGRPVSVLDTRDAPPGLQALRDAFPEVPLHSGPFDPGHLDGASLLAVSPGVGVDDPLVREARRRGIDVAGDIELFLRAVDDRVPVHGVTGTNGKSTVTRLFGDMLEADGRDVAVGGNLGEPALDLLSRTPAHGYVLELSSFQLELVERGGLTASGVLNLSPDHLDRHGTMERYAEAKRRIYRSARIAVHDGDDARIAPPDDFEGRRVVLRSRSAPAAGEWGVVGDALCGPQGTIVELSALPVAGRHNAFNVLAALAFADAVGVGSAAALSAVANYEPLPHRCIPVACLDDVRFVNDSKATNVGACRAALEGLGAAPTADGTAADGDTGPGEARRLVLIAGGLGKGADFTELREAVAAHVRALVLIGTDAPALAEALGDLAPHAFAADMDDAVARARAFAQRGDTVLLAPACASFDQFDSFSARGDAFVASIRALAEASA